MSNWRLRALYYTMEIRDLLQTREKEREEDRERGSMKEREGAGGETYVSMWRMKHWCGI